MATPTNATPRPMRRPAPAQGTTARKPFDWTPVLVGIVALLSAVIGYLLFVP